jgi:hypothetical protein
VCVCESVSAIRRALQVRNYCFFVLITEKQQSTRGAASREAVQVDDVVAGGQKKSVN